MSRGQDPRAPRGRREPASSERRFDGSGAATFTVGLSAILLVLNQGGRWGWLSPYSLGLVGLSVAAMGVFVAIERRHPEPMLDLRLFRDRVFSFSAVSALLNYVALYGVIFLLPFYLIQGRGLTPEQAGLLLTAQPIPMAVMAPLSGALSDRIGVRGPATVGMLVLAAGLFVLSRLQSASSWSYVIAALAMIGIGTGIFISPNNSALMGAAPPKEQGIAGWILATARNVGMMLGVGLAGAVFSSMLGARGVHAPLGLLTQAVDIGFRATAAVALIGGLTSAIRSGSRPRRR